MHFQPEIRIVCITATDLNVPTFRIIVQGEFNSRGLGVGAAVNTGNGNGARRHFETKPFLRRK